MQIGIKQNIFSKLNFKAEPVRIDKEILNTQGQEIAHIKAELARNYSYSKIRLPYFYAVENFDFSALAKPHIHISDLYVSPEYRGQGYGKSLIRYAVEKSKELNCDGRVILLAGSNEKSPLPFYKKLGFLSVSSKTNRLIDEAIKFKKELDNTIQTFMYLPEKKITKLLHQIIKR